MTLRKQGFDLSRILRTKAKSFHRGSDDYAAGDIHFSSSGGTLQRIMVLGDSNAFRPDGGNTSWPGLLQDKDLFCLKVLNESCDGRTTQYDTGERNALNVIEDKLAAHIPLDYVILMLGTNDVKSQYGPPSAADVASGIGRILDL